MVEYTDEFPADNNFEEKIFTFAISLYPIEGNLLGSLTSPPPEIIADGVLEAGKQIVISITTTNDVGYPNSFVQLVEIRDGSGVTVFLAWQSSVAYPYGQTEVGVSWTPDKSGDYEVRTFAISDLDSPQVLSLMSTTDFMVE